MNIAARRLALVIAALLLTAACGTQESKPQPTDDENLMGHIHGIGVDPADDTLYVATHYGLFHLDGNEATRVADRWQDTMAFTVVGDHHFLGSGHPDLREDLPPHLGLIESTDAGKTWQSLALQGKADFHALEAAGDTLYGYDSVTGSLLVSTDRRNFRTVTRLNVADLAVDPSDPDRLLATTQQGLVSIHAAPGDKVAVQSPLLTFIDWPRSDLLVGLAPEGQVHLSHDGGESWTEVGSVPGQATALEVTDEAWYAATGDGLFRSTDNGGTWQQIRAADG